MSQFFLYSEDNQKELLRIIFEYGKVKGFEDFVDELMALSDLYKKDRCDGVAMIEWFWENQDKDDLQQIKKKIFEKISVEHLLVIIRQIICRGEKIVLLLDNIDRLQRGSQPYCYDYALALNNNVNRCSKIIVAVRHENAHLPLEIQGQHSENYDRIYLAYHSYRSSMKTYLDPEGFHDILNSRIICYEKNCGLVDFDYKIKYLTDELKSQYIEYKMIDLANQSIRQALSYHCDLIEYILDNFDFKYIEGYLREPQKKSPFLTSLFVSWVVNNDEVIDDQSLNIVKILRESERQGYRPIGCDLSYLILTNLYKETISEDGREIKTVSIGELVENLGVLGFEGQEVKEKILILYNNKNKDFGHIIYISNDELVDGINSLSDEMKISLNYRGRCLVREISITFTFLNKIIHNSGFGSSAVSADEMVYHEFASYLDHGFENLGLMYRIAYLHALELIRISKCMTSYGDRWLTKYKNMFCVEGELQLVRMINSHLAFLENIVRFYDGDKKKQAFGLIAKYKLLKNLYIDDTESINFETHDIYNYKKIWKAVRQLEAEDVSLEISSYSSSTVSVELHLSCKKK